MTAHPADLFRPQAIEARRQRLEGTIILSQPVRAHILAILLVAVVAALAAWVVLGTYTRSAVARGMLVTDAPTAKVLAIRPGQVTQLLVRDGDHVEAGDRLAVVMVERPDENGATASDEALAALDEQRLLSEQQAELARHRAAADRARLAATLRGLERQRSDLAQQIALQEQTVASARRTFDNMSKVVEKGFVSKIEFEGRRQALLAAEQQLAQLQAQSNSLEAQERQTVAEQAGADADAGTAVATARTAAEGFVEQRAETLAARAYVISAPVAGQVTALQVKVGATVDPATPLMEVVPEDSPLHAEVYAPSSAVGFVKEGEEVRLLYDAFPYQRFGSFRGRLTRVSRTALDPKDIAAPVKADEPMYRIDVVPDRSSVSAFGDRIPLQSGMTLSANLILDRRSFSEWLLEPLHAVLHRTK